MEIFFPYAKLYERENRSMNTTLYLNSLDTGQSAIVGENRHTGAMRRRLMDIGLIRAVIALRSRDAALIEILPGAPSWD